MAVTLSATISTLIFLPFWGKFSDKYGNVKTIRLTGVLIPIIPLLWLLPIFISSNNSVILWLLIIAEIFAGVIWAGFNLAIGNFIYDAVSRERLAICTAYFSIIAGFGVVLGAFLGGILSSHNFVLFGLSPILTLFLLSAGLRAIAHLFIGREFMEVRKTKEFGIKEAKEKIKNLSFNKFLEYMDINFARGFFHW
jgi:MFS family permease